MKKHLSTIILILVLLLGFSLLLYPMISDYINSLNQSKAIASYVEKISSLDENDYNRVWNEAVEYNSKLASSPLGYELSQEEKELYNSVLNPAENGIMGYVDIPTIGVSLPIYHGTDESVLQTSVGHIEWTSLPVGEPNSHCVISGHRGLPSAKLFTDLDELKEGDIFLLYILDKTLTYEVDQILIIEPHDTSAIKITEGEDLCTLMTCTPYGVNSHRLLVRGHRIENAATAVTVHITADALQIDPNIVALVTAIPVLTVLFVTVLLKPNRKKKTGDDKYE